MTQLPISQIPVVAEDDASGDVAEIYDDIRRVMEIPFVPNIHKALGSSATALQGTWDAFRNIFLSTSLPMPVATMILYSIAAAKQCQYCSAVHQVTCKSLGVEEDTLAALDGNLQALAPQRVQAIIMFAQKCALDPQALDQADYDNIRAQGINDQEIVEIISLAALGNYLDTLADAMKIEIDSVFAEVLEG